MPPPGRPPIGLHLTRTARVLSRAFENELAAAGGSEPVWLILLSLKAQQLGNQRKLAEAIGIKGATLTHHLTDAGQALFQRLRGVAVDFDRRLRAGLSEEDVATLAALLDRLRGNVA